MIEKKCRVSGEKFEITKEDLEFYAKMEVIAKQDLTDLLSGKIIDCVGLPTLCPEERCRRRLSWQNMKNLYQRECDKTNKNIISNVSEEKLYPIYDQEFWWSGDWDFRDYGRMFDFTRPFFNQLQELLEVVPQPNLGTSYLLDENSKYTNYAGGNKNCYLIFHADMNRDCLYGVGVKKCEDAIDVTHVHQSELIYESVDCRKCYNILFSQNCENCSDSWFLKNCIGCKNCFGCVNLNNKEYYFLNEKLSKEDYEKKLAELELNKYLNLKNLRISFTKYSQQHLHRAYEGFQNEGSVGDQIFRCKNVKQCFDVQESRDMKFCHRVYNGPNFDCYDLNEYGMNIQKVYEGLAIGINANQIMSCVFTNEQVSDIYYSFQVHHSNDIFGCVSAV